MMISQTQRVLFSKLYIDFFAFFPSFLPSSFLSSSLSFGCRTGSIARKRTAILQPPPSAADDPAADWWFGGSAILHVLKESLPWSLVVYVMLDMFDHWWLIMDSWWWWLCCCWWWWRWWWWWSQWNSCSESLSWAEVSGKRRGREKPS